jgi:hypothetical protein
MANIRAVSIVVRMQAGRLAGIETRTPDNSAKSLEEVLEHYVFMFTANTGFPLNDSNILLTPQDIKDIIAFMRLL